MKIAIIGTGISANIASYLLNQQHDIAVYEKNSYVGGHSRTLSVQHGDRQIDVDTGFIVFNYRNYPVLTAMFAHLNVAVEKSDMSFAASINNGWLEYNTQTTAGIFAQKRNLFSPQYLLFLRDILKFFKASKQILDAQDYTTKLGDFSDQLKLGDWFKRYFLLPMGGAIWSCPLEQMLEFPAYTFVRFFDNHGLLAREGQPQWHTVSGGSKNYVAKLTESFASKIRLNCAATKIVRTGGKVQVTDATGTTEIFDHVVISAHGDEALKLLADPSADEQQILSNFTYQTNIAYLHCDESLMPKNHKCWASWNYLSNAKQDNAPDIAVSYWMNLLQNIDKKYPLFVTLNPSVTPAPEKVFNRHEFAHPVFTTAAIAAQKELPKIQGAQNTWFCGAYQRYGFHEDGAMSGLQVAQSLGATTPW